MLRAQKPLHLRQAEKRRQKPLPDLVCEQAVAVLGEGRRVERLLVDRQSDEPAKQKVELDPLDQLPLRPDRIEKLQKRGPQQPLRRNGRTSAGLVKRRKRSVQIRQRRVGQPSHRPQRMLRRNPRLDVDIREQRRPRPILASHRSLAIRLDNPTNHAKRPNTSDFFSDFFSSRLAPVVAPPIPTSAWREIL